MGSEHRYHDAHGSLDHVQKDLGSRLMPRTVSSAQSQPCSVFASDDVVIMIGTDVSLS